MDPATKGQKTGLADVLANHFSDRVDRADSADAQDASAVLRDATVAIAGGGPMLPALVAGLGSYAIGKIALLGDAAVTELDVQQSKWLRAGDLGKPISQAITARALPAGTGTELTPVADRPTTKLEWQQALRGCAVAVVLIEEPILFPTWLEAFNHAALDVGIPWTSASLHDGKELHLGPTVIPGETSCYTCYELRYKSNMSHYEAYLHFENYIRESGDNKDFGLFTPLSDLLGGMVAIEAVNTLTPGVTPRSRGKLLTFSPAQFTIEEHPVLKLPRCSACTPAINAPAERTWR